MRQFSKKEKKVIVDGRVMHYRNLFRTKSYRKLIDFFFYLALLLIGGLGFLIYLKQYYPDYAVLHDLLLLKLVHSNLSLIFIALLILRYYLAFTMWYERFMHYLKTH